MKAKFTAIGDQRVMAEYDGCYGIRVRRTFFCNAAPGYHTIVFEEMHQGEPRFACLGLAEIGRTLWVRDGEKLIDVIRREYRRT